MPYVDQELKQAYMVRRNQKKRGPTKVCITCKVEQPEENFLKKLDRTRNRNRRSSYCHPCRKLKMQDYMWRSNYGLSRQQFEELVAAQDNKCAICLTGFEQAKMKKRCVDHRHEDGKVRGILCVPCNAMLGNAYEKKELLESAIAYLERHK